MSVERKRGLRTEANREMEKETIIFFDKLGFGWVLDNMTATEMHFCQPKEGSAVNNSLIKIIENLLENPGV
jgi:hypothetical protein